MKKILSVFAAFLLLAALTGCGKKPVSLDPSNDWCWLEKGQLVVSLPSPEGSDYQWDYTVSENSPASLSDRKTHKNHLILTFAAVGEGDVSISFACANASDLTELRMVQCAASGGAFTEITQNDRMSMNRPLE